MEKSIDEFVKEMKTVFGDIGLKAENFETGQKGKNSHWVELPKPHLEIGCNEYMALGNLNVMYSQIKENTLVNFLTFIKAKERRYGFKPNQR